MKPFFFTEDSEEQYILSLPGHLHVSYNFCYNFLLCLTREFLSHLIPQAFNMEAKLPKFLIYFSFMLIRIMLEHGQGINALHVGNMTDRLALLAFKARIIADPHQVLTSWNNSAHFCSWPGITCSRRHGRVTGLQLPDLGLTGQLSVHLGNLSFLRSLDIHKNGFHGSIPMELARLYRLKVLTIANNSLRGEIPASLSNCSHLFYLNLGGNRLVGNVPAELGSLSQLGYLVLPFNKLIGTIPPSLGNLSRLEFISLAGNSIEGSIPSELGQLFGLRVLYFGNNKLSGTFPPALYNLSSVTDLSVETNQLLGRLPSSMGLTMSNLETFYVGGNNFSGPLPNTLANASHLIAIDLQDNFFTGHVPVDLGKLQNLSVFAVQYNMLGSGGKDDLQFVTSLSNCSGLVTLSASFNRLGGSLPNSIANLSSLLTILILGKNQIHGAVPSGIDNLMRLQVLGLEYNHLTGKIPAAIGKLQQLVWLYLDVNKLSGKIPSNIGNLTQLTNLYIDDNELQGHIPSSIGNYRGLLYLGLSNNMLSGQIPISLFNLSSVVNLRMDNNLLTGSLPPEVGSMIYLINFRVHDNCLSGEIPLAIGDCSMLQQLFMHNNSFSGIIPLSLANVKGIEQLDLSLNNFSGKVPEFLSKLKHMNYLDLSFNNLEGVVPKVGVFSNISAFSVDGNPKLCGGIPQLHLAPCATKVASHGRKSLSWKIKVSIVAVSTVGALVLFCLVIIYKIKHHKSHHSSTSCSIDLHVKVSYADLFKATDGFSSSNLIGLGSFGSIYKGVLEYYQHIVAIKVLNLDQVHALKTFMDECEALRNIRHRNLVKILTSCSSLDFKGNDFKALVFELMPNGSIEEWLHQQMNGNDSPKYLSFSKRLDVAIDVANALDYLHNQCNPPIVHCDIKPNNIFLDDDMVAHLGDFGLAKSLVTSRDYSSSQQTSASVLKGSIGYIAPEYGTRSIVTTHGDVYSYGIVLLEMITGKKPIDEMFNEGLNLSKFVKMAIPKSVMEIVDPSLLQESPCENDRWIECFVCVAKIGVICSAAYPQERMNMRDICRELVKVRQVFHEIEISRITRV